MTILNVSRRDFLRTSSWAAATLTLSVGLPVTGRHANAAGTPGAPTRLNAFLEVGPDGGVTFYSPFIEMGQGTYTSLPQIVAEELDVELDRVRVVQAPHGPDYRIMFGGTRRFTGGSFSVRSSYETLRKVGAAARQMLIQAAAQQWQVDPSALTTEPGRVIDAAGGRSAGYGDLVGAAGNVPAPADPPLKDPASFRLIGTPAKRTDTRAKSNGSAVFGIDVQVPGMVYAAVRQSPVFGGDVAAFEADAVMAMPGVLAVERVPAGVAVVADSFWRAKTALDALPVEFSGGAVDFSSEGAFEAMRVRVDEPGVTAEDAGDVGGAFEDAARTIDAVYEAPFLAHVTMEPMNATAQVTADSCTVWAPNQGADLTAEVAASITGLPLEKIQVITPYLGGGYGRRFMQEFTAHAVILAQAVGRPVKVIWTREQDVQHDHYRPLTVVKHRAAFDAAGGLIGWHSTAVGEGPIGRHFATAMEDGIDPSVLEGNWQQPYAAPSRRVDWVHHGLATPVGFWRSVGHSFNGFFTESFVDEMAAAAGVEPLAFRRQLLEAAPRELEVLNAVAEMAGYRAEPWQEDGVTYAMGIALHESFGSIIGQVARVSIDGGQPVPHEYWCVVDCGRMVNPDIIEAQMQSGISTGLSQALLEEITVAGGRVEQGNFDTYPVLPPHLMPKVTVQIIESGAELGGIGEPGTPPAAAALANAVFKLTGQRIRRLPFSRYDLAAEAI